jgi:hypothetical protein
LSWLSWLERFIRDPIIEPDRARRAACAPAEEGTLTFTCPAQSCRCRSGRSQSQPRVRHDPSQDSPVRPPARPPPGRGTTARQLPALRRQNRRTPTAARRMCVSYYSFFLWDHAAHACWRAGLGLFRIRRPWQAPRETVRHQDRNNPGLG